MIIRPIEEADVDGYIAAYALVSGEGRFIGGELPLSPAKLEVLRSAPMRGDRQLTLVAVDDHHDDRLVGWAVVEHAPYGRSHLGMGLIDGYRGRGLGRQLLDAAIEWSREQGAHKLDLEVWPHNEAAIALYERAGFVREGLRRRHWRRNNGELWDSVEMSYHFD